jgi:ribonucleoside-diphosphate reductase subunit M1
VVCPWLLCEFVDLDLWDDKMKNMIIVHNRSVQNIPSIPDDVKAIYKTVWEISQKKVLDLAADCGAYICQSQSLNVHSNRRRSVNSPVLHFYGWKKGLKTGMYYLRTRPAAQAIQFTVDQSLLKDAKKAKAKPAGSAGADRKSRISGVGITTPSPSPWTTPARSNGVSVDVAVKQEPVTPTLSGLVSPPPSSVSIKQAVASLALDDKTAAAAEADPEFAAALQRQCDRETEEAQMLKIKRNSVLEKRPCIRGYVLTMLTLGISSAHLFLLINILVLDGICHVLMLLTYFLNPWFRLTYLLEALVCLRFCTILLMNSPSKNQVT